MCIESFFEGADGVCRYNIFRERVPKGTNSNAEGITPAIQSALLVS
jgi:hypothetical protein